MRMLDSGIKPRKVLHHRKNPHKLKELNPQIMTRPLGCNAFCTSRGTARGSAPSSRTWCSTIPSIEFDGNGKQSAATTTPSSTIPSIFPV
jgi:hypothetical protein